MIAIGSKVPDFKLDDQFDEEVSLADFKGKKILLSFHPLAWTGICTQQMQKVDELYDKFAELGVTPFGMSVDASPSKKAWSESMGLKKLRMLADFWPHGGVADSLGIFRQQDGFSERANVLIEDGKVVWMAVYEIRTLPDFKDVFEFLGK